MSAIRAAGTTQFRCDSVSASPAHDRWYVVHTQPHAENRAFQRLQAQGYYAFCPRLRKVVRHARRVSIAHTAFFPRYIFVRLDISRQQWRSINGTSGVVRLIMQGDGPVPVPRGVVEALVERTVQAGNIAQPICIGQKIHIAEGPFAGLTATLERLDERGRVHVLLQLLGRSVSVTLNDEVVSLAQ
ncbi:MAG: transcriptional activator RfaH [Alphaproteobacteria bacterium]|nr:transcriptional activator RfaH [Alphaproteobacteria bacterium]